MIQEAFLLERALCSAVIFLGIAAASDLRPNIRNNCSRKQDKARHIVCLDCFNFKGIEVPPLTDVRRKVKKLQLKTNCLGIFYFFFLFIAFVRGNEGTIMLAAEDREVN